MFARHSRSRRRLPPPRGARTATSPSPPRAASATISSATPRRPSGGRGAPPLREGVPSPHRGHQQPRRRRLPRLPRRPPAARRSRSLATPRRSLPRISKTGTGRGKRSCLAMSFTAPLDNIPPLLLCYFAHSHTSFNSHKYPYICPAVSTRSRPSSTGSRALPPSRQTTTLTATAPAAAAAWGKAVVAVTTWI